ncbi:uncharacterized protein [Blastocystis hominis]|uniref:Protein YIF1 n=1 Tax=Blastocystis hominis TaxID=12968 RepID=D8M0R8_BLAHO|nr:uncharacterized protein [Blastocystis hominis]CBK21657.2 unnamed protein product [Blastocystis hominis]|eukprot:XP_012895705.1 uncharacterized protein [Blastocystis hominis]
MSGNNPNPFVRRQVQPANTEAYYQQPQSQQPPFVNTPFQQGNTEFPGFSSSTLPTINTGNAVFDMAFNQTTNLMKSKWDNYTPEATGLWNNFKKYFQVSNQYVVAKLRLILFPFMSQSWKRLITVGEDGQKYYLPPRQDVYAFDLYIPLMAIFTFIVTVGFTAGTKGIFSPQIISTSLSACSVSIILELLLLKLILFLISCPAPILDLLSLISYKFVGLCINSVIYCLSHNRTFYTVSLLYTGMHSLKAIVYEEKEQERKKRRLRNYFVLLWEWRGEVRCRSSVMQVVLMWLLGRYMG